MNRNKKKLSKTAKASAKQDKATDTVSNTTKGSNSHPDTLHQKVKELSSQRGNWKSYLFPLLLVWIPVLFIGYVVWQQGARSAQAISGLAEPMKLLSGKSDANAKEIKRIEDAQKSLATQAAVGALRQNLNKTETKVASITTVSYTHLTLPTKRIV